MYFSLEGHTPHNFQCSLDPTLIIHFLPLKRGPLKVSKFYYHICTLCICSANKQLSNITSERPPLLLLFLIAGPPIQVVPFVHAGTPLTPLATPLTPLGTPVTPLATPLNTPAGTPIRLLGSPTTPQTPQIGFIQRLKTIIPQVASLVVTKHFDLTMNSDSPVSAVGSNQGEGSYSSQPPTPRTPVSHVIDHMIMWLNTFEQNSVFFFV